MQPGPQREFVQGVAAALADEASPRDEPGDLTIARPLVGTNATGHPGHEAAMAFELDAAGELQADEAIQIEVRPLASLEVVRVGRLQDQSVLEQVVDALAALQLQRHQRRRASHFGDRRASHRQGSGGMEKSHLHLLKTHKSAIAIAFKTTFPQ